MKKHFLFIPFVLLTSMLAAAVMPAPAYAQEENPPEASDEPIVINMEEADVESIILVDPQITETTIVDPDAILLDDPAIESLFLSDPWYSFNGVIYRFFAIPNPGDPDPCVGFTPGTCFTALFPITAALDDAAARMMPTGESDRPTIFVEGTHTEDLDIRIPVWLQGVSAIINGTIDINSDYVVIDGFTINGSVQAVVTQAEFTAGEDGYQGVQISNNVINASGQDAGVIAGQDSIPTDLSTTFSPQSLYGGVQSDFSGLTIIGNIITEADQAGILLKGATGPSGSIRILRNDISLSGVYPQLNGTYDPSIAWIDRGEGIWVESSSYVEIIANVLEYNSRGGIWVSSSTDGFYDMNGTSAHSHHISILANIVRNNDLGVWVEDVDRTSFLFAHNNLYSNWRIMASPSGQYYPYSNYTGGAALPAYGNYRAGGYLSTLSFTWLEDYDYNGTGTRSEWCIRSDWFDDLDRDGLMDAIDTHSDPVCVTTYPHTHSTPDNCPAVYNPDQTDSDSDGTGDACEDDDTDGVLNAYDNCPVNPNADQADSDGDGIGDVCDPLDNGDDDLDNIENWNDTCPGVTNTGLDSDGDGIDNACDITPPQEEDNPVPVIVPTIDLPGGSMQTLSCVALNRIVLPSGDYVQFFTILCDFEASLVQVEQSSLPRNVDIGAFDSAMTLSVQENDTTLELLMLGTTAKIAFEVPEESEDTYAILYWNASMNDGQGGWVELSAGDVPEWYEGKEVYSGMRVYNNTNRVENIVSIVVNFPGTFVLVTK